MAIQDVTTQIKAAAALIRSACYLTAFTGAGVSVESGIPPFRGPGGPWGKYDPSTLELNYFLASPAARGRDSDGTDGRGGPSGVALGARGYLKVLITQNSDSVQLN